MDMLSRPAGCEVFELSSLRDVAGANDIVTSCQEAGICAGYARGSTTVLNGIVTSKKDLQVASKRRDTTDEPPSGNGHNVSISMHE